MAATADSTNKSPLIVMSIIGLIVMATLVYVFTRPHKSEMVTELYQYYPQNTALYVEIAPGDKLSTRLMSGLDKLRSMSNNPSTQTKTQLEAVFKKDFEPQMSIGAWAPAGATSKPAANPSGSPETPVLLIVPVKSGVTLDSLLADLNVPKSDFTSTKEGDTEILVSNDAKNPPLALDHGNLITASSLEVLKQGLAERKTPETLLDNPLYKANLPLLPAVRQGTVLALTGEMQNFPKSSATNPGLDNITEFQKQIGAATPVMVGSITVDKDQYINFDSFTPVDLEKIQDVSFRKDVQTLFTKTGAFNLANLLPKDTVVYGGILGLGSYYDLFVNHIATPEMKQSIAKVEPQLAMMGLDLRKNIVSLLDGQSAVGITAKQGMPDVLVFLNHNPDTEKTMSQFGMMAAQMTGGSMTDKKMDDSHVVKVLESPAMPVKVAYSNVQPETLVVGTQSGVEEMYNVQQKKSPSLSENPLYKELVANMPSKVSSVFFVDFTQGANLLDELAKRSHNQGREQSVKEVLGGIEGVAGSNAMDGEKMMKGHISVKLSAQP